MKQKNHFELDLAPVSKRDLQLIEERSKSFGGIEGLEVKIPLYKRVMDILASGLALILLSPVFLIVAVLLKIESPKAPVFFISKRVGAGYKIFGLYKFRSMIPGAESKISSISHLNMYDSAKDEVENVQLCANCIKQNKTCDGTQLFVDGDTICENLYLERKHSQAAFMKFKNDPRITKLGSFLRNTSIDELPQLFNILVGDMCLVGNRPLPLYEAEKLTTDLYSKRFLGPAGLTGLWQVTKRGKPDMSETERIQLDNEYAENYGFMMDMKIIFKTFPALFQKAEV